MDALTENLRRKLLDALRGAAVLWSRRTPVDEAALDRIRLMLILDRHRHYVENIPVYRALAEEQGLAGGADLRAIVDGMLLSTDVFKSYDPRALLDVVALNRWIGEISTCRPPADARAADLDGWTAALAEHGIHVSRSSGTSGQPSFVPRDRETWAALCGNGQFYDTDPMAAPFDCVALMPRGGASGLQGAATGLARQAERAHFGGGPAAAAFLAESAGAGRRVLVFGPPFAALALCRHVLDAGPPVRLAAGSRVITGGGWKTATTVVGRAELHAEIERALGVAAVTDGYSMTELNCVISSCREGRYHVPPLVQPVLLDPALEWIPEAETTGLLGFLDPFAASYPGFLVTGDEGHLTRAPCPCGLGGWSVRGEITRAPAYEPKSCAGTLAAVTA